MKILKMLSKPAAWGSGWTSAFLCFSAATGYWIAGEPKRAMCWVGLGVAEIAAIVLWTRQYGTQGNLGTNPCPDWGRIQPL